MHVQRRCQKCRRTVEPNVRRCRCRGDPSYVARYRDPDGVERSQSFDRRDDADAFLADQEAKKRQGEWVDPAAGRVTLREWLPRWLQMATPSLKPKTAATYAGLVRSQLLPRLGGFTLAGLTPSDVQEAVNAMAASGLSPSRIRQAHVLLGQALGAAVRDRRIARNVAQGTRLPRLQRREAPFLHPERVQGVAEAMPEPYGLLVRILGTVGPRFGEAAALRRRSVDLLGRRLVISESLAEVSGHLIFGPTKTHATRRVPLTASLAQALTEHLEAMPADPDALAFTSPEGAPLRYSTFRERYWRPALKRAGIPPVGLHVLRHSAAAAMIRAGASPKAVQSILGHASAAFTLTVYGHIFEADLDRVAEALELHSAGPLRDRDGTTALKVLPTGG